MRLTTETLAVMHVCHKWALYVTLGNKCVQLFSSRYPLLKLSGFSPVLESPGTALVPPAPGDP